MTSPLKALLLVAAAAAMVGTTTGVAAAQATGNIRGKVVEATTQLPLSGVQVFVVGTGRGALTNAAGDFLLLNVPAGQHTVRTEMIGYAPAERTVTVTAGQSTVAGFELTVRAINLDAIVVTGTAGAVSKRTLGNAITTVNAAEVTKDVTVTNLTELLQARSPGVQILPNSGVPGAAADIRIRGASSFGDNRPVVYVDGIRYNIDDLGSFTPSGAGTTSYSGQTTSALSLISPEDIESIEVIKGPAAATLYGADAAGGVIQIITKKGARGEQRARWDLKFEQGQNEWALDIPDNYTMCDAAKRSAFDRQGNPTWPGCQNVPEGTVLRDNPLRRDPLALRTGTAQRLTLSVRGGGERYSYYIAGDKTLDEGVFYTSFDDRKSVRANFHFAPSEKLDFQINTSYLRDELRLPIGDESAQGLLLSAFRGKPGRVPPGGWCEGQFCKPRSDGWAFTNPEEANEYNNRTEADRMTLGGTVNLNPFPWFRNRLTLGLDYTGSQAKIISPPGSTDAQYAGVAEGIVAERQPRTYVYTMDYVGNVERGLTGGLISTTSFGVQAITRRYESLYAQGTGFGAPDVLLIGTAQTTVGSNAFVESKLLGLFGQEQFGWKDRLYVTAAVRMDNSSVFGSDIKRIFYPKASVSWMLSEEPALQSLFERARINTFKFRTAWGQAGRAPAPFAASQTYTVDQGVVQGQIISALRARSYGNPSLKPERGDEIEVGFDAGLFQDRAGLEFTYYRKRMNDVIISVAPPGSSGFGSRFSSGTLSLVRNLGQTRNSGIELGVAATPIQRRNLVWDARISLATNQNELIEFGDGRPSVLASGASYGAVQKHVAKCWEEDGATKCGATYPLAGYWAPMPADANGNPTRDPHAFQVNARRDGVVLTDTSVYIGPSVPTRELSFSNTFTVFRNFRIYALFDYKGGHYLYNYREYNRCRFHLNCAIDNDPRALNPQTAADSLLWKQMLAARTAASPGNGYFIEKADFIKLRDLSLTYVVPTEFARRFRASAASLTLAGHNLALWSDYSGVDPETNNYGNRSFVRADIYALPMIRRLSVAINLSF